MKRLLLFVVVAAITLLLAEGLVSALAGRSLLGGRASLVGLPGGPGGADLGGGVRDEERSRAAAGNPGLYRVHPDPRVGYVLRADAELTIHDGLIRSDDLGLRVRPDGPAPADALRIAVLGDSVAFGFGLDDDETLAHRLEHELSDARGPGARPLAARTVAIPGWNHRNAVQFLRDHFEQLRPDLVVYVPVANDLFDTDGVYETGHRRWAPDPAAGDPWLRVYQGGTWRFAKKLLGDLSNEAIDEARRRSGAPALVADLSPESSSRYDDDAQSIVGLAGWLRGRGGQLVVSPYVDVPFGWHLMARVHEADPSIPIVPLFGAVGPGFTLATDAHPRAGTIAAGARRVARFLLEQELLEGEPGGVPADDAEYDPTRPPARPPEDWARLSAEQRDTDTRRLVDTVSFETLVGLSQVYGGVNDDGTVGARALFLLGRGGGPLRVTLAAIEERPDLLPQPVRVEIDGRTVGQLVLSGTEPVSRAFDLPLGAAPVEVRLVPDHWGVVRDRGSSQLVSFRPLELSTRDG